MENGGAGDDNIAWISGSLVLPNQSKPSPNEASQPSFAAEGNETALWEKLVDLNQRQEYTTPPALAPLHAQEDEFVRLILTIEGDKLSRELFTLLFDMLINNSFLTERELEAKGDFLYIFFELLRLGKCDVPVQVALFQELHRLVSAHTRLKRHCCAQKWVLRLLERLPWVDDERLVEQYIQLIQTIGTFSISVEEMQAMFRLMNPQSSLFKPTRLAVLLDTIRVMSQRVGPDLYFDFNGRDSGLKLAPLPKGWPGGEGYGFATWLRVESFEEPLAGRHYQPYLFSFTSLEGPGVEAFLLNRLLHLRISSSKNKQATVQMDQPLQAGVWHFLFISHVYHFIRRSEVSFYLDGKLVNVQPLIYPKSDKPLTQAVIGNNSMVFSRQGADRTQPFFGQMSCMYMFAANVPKHEDVHTMYLQGPNFTPLIDPVEGKVLVGVGSHTNQFLLDGRRSLKIQASFEPKAVYSGDRCLDTSTGDLQWSAIRLPGTTTVRTHGIKETLYCTGGIRILLPLFRSLDQPIVQGLTYPGDSNMNGDEGDQVVVDSHVDPNFALQVFQLLQTMLKNNPQNQQHMVLAHGFQVIGHLLESIHPQCWTPSTLLCLEQLAQVILGCEPLFRQLILSVYLNFRIWIYTPPEVQRELVDILLRHVKKNPPYFRQLVGVQRLMDILRKFYWFTPESLSEATQPIVHPVTLETLGKRPDHHVMKQIRVAILQVVRNMAPDGFSEEETRALVFYLQDCQDPEQGVDVLQMLLAVLSAGSRNNKSKYDTLDALLSLGGLSPFLRLLQRTSLMQRIWSLKMIAKLLQLARARRKEKQVGTPRLQLLKKYLVEFSFNETTYFALLEVMLEVVNNREFKNPLQHAVDEKELTIRHPLVLGVILEMLLSAEQSALQFRVLQDLVHLLQQSADNRALFLRQPYWQTWLLGVLTNRSLGPGHSQEIAKQVVKLMGILFHQCLSLSQGWRVFVDTQGLLHHLEQQGLVDGVAITREINAHMLRHIAYDAHILQQAYKNPTLWENLTRWLAFTEEGLFVSLVPPPPGEEEAEEGTDSSSDDHFLLGVHRHYNGMWIDFEFAQKLLDYLDSFLLSPSQVDEAKAPGASVSEESLLRLALRLTLYTLYETDAFLNTEKIQERSRNLKSVESAIDEHFAQEHGSPGMRDGLSKYLQGKIKQWNSEMNSVDKVFQKNIDRLRQLVRRLLRSPSESTRLMYIISFLYQAMKRSYDHQGIGAELILHIFKEILLLARPSLPLPTELTTMRDEQFVEFFMRHFAFPTENPALFQPFDSGVKQVLADERAYSQRLRDQLQRNTLRVWDAMEAHRTQEEEVLTTLQTETSRLLEEQRALENERLASVQRMTFQARSSLTKRTKSTFNELSHERGPWATPESIRETLYWKLSHVETPSRMRPKLKRNRHFDPHIQCAKGDPALGQSGEGALGTMPLPRVSPGAMAIRPPLARSGSELLASPEVSEGGGDVGETVSNNESTILLQCACDLITPLLVTPGSVELTPTTIYFIVDKDAPVESVGASSPLLQKPTSSKWAVRALRHVYGRRYLLRNNALELFLTDHTTHFLNFPSTRLRNAFWKKLMDLRPPALVDWGSGGSFTNLTGFGSPPTGSQLLKRMNITARWRNREISNFDYIMWLNTLAGRTYNDLTQYPIFPWILADYTSSQLDLTNPRTFRDLSLPIGALNPQRLAQFLERYRAFDDPYIPKFHYGSHYSNVGVVLYYLLRMEPFTTYFLSMQGGKFDHPARMFMSLLDTWQGVLSNPSDVKELIPEFFYLPEFMENQNDFCFGYYNGHEVRCDVELPPWAANAHDFVTQHREALESDYVSAHLHEWLDLIFGYKQRGPDAEEAHNLFYYLTYEGVIDIDAITDPVERRSIEAQIINFGQTPSQLFEKPHPARKSPEQLAQKNQRGPRQSISPFYDLQVKVTRPVIFVQYCETADRLLFVTMDGVLGSCAFVPGRFERGVPYAFEADKLMSSHKTQRRLDMIYPRPIACPSACFAASGDGKLLFSCGMWKDDVQARALSQWSRVISAEHRDLVTCLSLTRGGQLLVSGSYDCTVVVWHIEAAAALSSSSISSFWNLGKSAKNAQLFTVKHILYGHTAPITCVDVSADYDVVVSGSQDKTVILFHLTSGKFLRSIPLLDAASQICFSSQGLFVVYCEGPRTLLLYTLNGVLLQQRLAILPRILTCQFSPDGHYFVTAGVGNAVLVRQVPSFQVVYVFEVPCPVFTIDFAVGGGMTFLLLGLMNGQVRVCPFDPFHFCSAPPPDYMPSAMGAE